METELVMKNQYIRQLEGDIKQIKQMAVEENMQYLRHTLVKFLWKFPFLVLLAASPISDYSSSRSSLAVALGKFSGRC